MSSLFVFFPCCTNAIGITSDDDTLINFLHNFYAPYAYFDTSVVADIVTCYINSVDNYLLINNKEKYYINNIKTYAIKIVNIIIRRYSNLIRGWNIYHGASVSIAGETILLLGGTGSGKSTTTCLLCHQQNAQYIAEDILLVNHLENHILLYPRKIFLREDIYGILRNNYDMDEVFFSFVEYQSYKRYVYTPRHECCNKISEINRVFVLDPDAKGDDINVWAHNCHMFADLKYNILSAANLAKHNHLTFLNCNKKDILDNITQQLN